MKTLKLTQFRLQRGSLEESLKTTIDVNSPQDILNYLRNKLDISTVDYFDMIQEQWEIEMSSNMIFDKRCDWKSKTVCLKRPWNWVC